MKLSLAIINDDQAQYLQKLFESLGSRKDSLDIVFIDNCSCDNSIQIVKDLGIRKIVAFEKKQASRPVLYNKATSMTEGKYILFIHSDVIFADGFFENLERSLEANTDLGFMNFWITYVDKTTIAPSIICREFENIRIKLSYHSIWVIKDPAIKKILSCSESCFLVHSTIFRHEHFDERYLNSLFVEDLVLKLYFQGVNIVYNEDSYIEHYFLEQHKSLKTLKHDMRLFEKNNLKALQVFNLIEQDKQISSLETSLQEKVAQVHRLESQIYQIQQSIPMQLMYRYQRIIDKLMRPGTRRRRPYELMLSSIRVILNKGWKGFFREVRAYLLSKRDRTSKQQ